MNKKTLVLISAAFVVLFLVFVVAIIVSGIANPFPKEEYIENFYNSSSYAMVVQTEYDEGEVYEEQQYYTEDQGILKADEHGPYEFIFLTQDIFKDIDGNWDIIVTESEFIPGSPEDLIGKKEELDLDKFEKIENNKYCSELELVDNCVVWAYEDELEIQYEFYFNKSEKDIALLRMNPDDYEETRYYFGEVNNPDIQVGAKFEEMQEEIDEDLIKLL